MKDSNGNEHVWRRVKIIVLLPLTIFLWMTGWTLYWVAAQRTSSRTAKKKIMKETTLRESSPQQILA